MLNRRSLIAGILASGFAPAIGHAGILMPVRKVWTGGWDAGRDERSDKWLFGYIDDGRSQCTHMRGDQIVKIDTYPASANVRWITLAQAREMFQSPLR
jgi:hypothetical protein